MTPREALDDVLGRIPSAQSQHAEPARLVLEQALTALDESAGLLDAAKKEIERLNAKPPADPPAM